MIGWNIETDREDKISFPMLLFNSNKWVVKHDIFNLFSGPTVLSKNNFSLNSLSEKYTTAGGWWREISWYCLPPLEVLPTLGKTFRLVQRKNSAAEKKIPAPF
jgi:hypothetical protein